MSRESSRCLLRAVRTALLPIALCLAGASREVLSQPPELPLPGGQAAVFEVDQAAARKLSAARELILNRKWRDAIELIEQSTAVSANGLVAIEPGRLISIRTAANLLLAAVSADGLATYRNRIDSLARRWFESGVESNDDSELERVVERAFHSSYGDQAIVLLGDRAFERGDPGLARSLWERLIPPFDSEQPPEGIPPVVYYPRPRIEISQIRARMILASLFAGESDRAVREAAQFRRRFPEAEGQLAGASGRLCDLLEAEIAANLPETESGPVGDWTFGGSASRSRVVDDLIDVGAIRWTSPLPRITVEFQESQNTNPFEAGGLFNRLGTPRGRANSTHDVLATFPIVHQQGVFYCDESSIHAYDLLSRRDAAPLWGDSPIIFSLDSVGPVPQGEKKIGLPAHTLSIANDRLFARLGRGAAVRSPAVLAESFPSTLVCLDLTRDGDLLWSVSAGRLAEEAGNWVFEGSPLPYDDRLFVLLRKSTPQPTWHIACLEPATGSLLWNRRLCQGVDQFSGEYDEQNSLLLSAADGRVYCSPNLGTVLAVQSRTGELLWTSTYPRIEFEKVPDYHDRQTLGPNPCVIADGLVFVAPTDSNSVLGFDAASGAKLWERPLPGAARQLIGVSQNRLVVAGDQLWGLNPETGAVAWIHGRDGPDAKTRGRGALAGNFVYWPREEEILVVETRSGRVRREISLKEHHEIPGGGNLVIAEGFLVCAQSDRLVAFWEYSDRKKILEDELAKDGDNQLKGLRLALHEEAQGETRAAVAAYQVALSRPPGRARWFGRPVSEVARDRAAPLMRRLAEIAREQHDLDLATQWYDASATCTPRMESRAACLAYSVESQFQLGNYTNVANRLESLRRDPDLIRLPREFGQTQTIGQFCGVESARVREVLRDEFDRLTQQIAADAVRHELSIGRMQNLPKIIADVRLNSELSTAVESAAEIAWNQRDLAAAQSLWGSLASHAATSAARTRAEARLRQSLTEEQPAERQSSIDGKSITGHDSNPYTEAAVFRTPSRSNHPRSLKGAGLWRAEVAGTGRSFSTEPRSADKDPDWLITATNEAACRRYSSGRTAWRMVLGEPVVWAGGSDATTILATRTQLCGIDAQTGAVRWLQPASTADTDAELPRYLISGEILLSLAAPRELRALDVRQGETLWRYPPAACRQSAAVEQRTDSVSSECRTSSPAPRLRPFWCEKERIVGVQTEAPRRTIFFDVDDGYSRELPTPPGHDWIADPRTLTTGEAWGVAACATTMHQIEGRIGQITPLITAHPQSGAHLAYRQGDLPILNGEFFLAPRDEIGVWLRRTTDGVAMWHLRKPGQSSARPGSIATDQERLYSSSGPVIRCYRLADGRLLWEHLVENFFGAHDLQLAVAGGYVLAWDTQSRGSLSIECIRVDTGRLCERWNLQGQPTAPAVTLCHQSAVVQTNAMVAVFQIPDGGRRK